MSAEAVGRLDLDTVAAVALTATSILTLCEGAGKLRNGTGERRDGAGPGSLPDGPLA